MKRVMVVDDSETARMFVQRCLEAIGLAGAEFVEAADGKEALEKLKAEPVDLVVTDLTMPEMNGESLLMRIKASPKLTMIPVLVISSAGNMAKAKDLTNQGAIGVLAKPFSPAELYTMLQPIMGAGG